MFQILVAKSPIAPFATFVYTIEAAGIVQQGKLHSLPVPCQGHPVYYKREWVIVLVGYCTCWRDIDEIES